MKLSRIIAAAVMAAGLTVPVAATIAPQAASATENCYHWDWNGTVTACINFAGTYVYWTEQAVTSQITDAWTMNTFSPYANWHWGPVYLGAGDGWIETPGWDIHVASGTEIGFTWCEYARGCLTEYIQVLGV